MAFGYSVLVTPTLGHAKSYLTLLLGPSLFPDLFFSKVKTKGERRDKSQQV